jgi:hypothetical protein
VVRLPLRALLALCALLVAFASHALVPVGIGYKWPGDNVTMYQTIDAACQAWLAGVSTGANYNYAGHESLMCKVTPKAGGAVTSWGAVSQVTGCPANSTAVSGGCQCAANYQESGGQCVPETNQCAVNAGKPMTIRVTIGYTRSPDDNDSRAVGPTFNPWNGAPVCSGGCTMNYSGVESAWISQAPNAQGLYRNSVDANYVNSGQKCTASGTNPADQAVNPQAPQPDCPGYVGEVNGKVGCYGTAAKPVTTGTKPTGIPQPPPRAGNPPAGERPPSGEGSASNPTPAAGNGGPEGGPAAAGVGGRGGGAGGTASGTGSSTNGEGQEEKDPCGAPGQAVCNVKVDENGTPATGGDGMGTSKLDQAMDKAEEGIAKAIDPSKMDTSWGGIPQWFASGGCTPWNLGTLPYINRAIVIDICPVAGYVVAVMSFLWVVGTFFAIIAMVGRVTGAGAH